MPSVLDECISEVGRGLVLMRLKNGVIVVLIFWDFVLEYGKYLANKR